MACPKRLVRVEAKLTNKLFHESLCNRYSGFGHFCNKCFQDIVRSFSMARNWSTSYVGFCQCFQVKPAPVGNYSGILLDDVDLVGDTLCTLTQENLCCYAVACGQEQCPAQLWCHVFLVLTLLLVSRSNIRLSCQGFLSLASLESNKGKLVWNTTSKRWKKICPILLFTKTICDVFIFQEMWLRFEWANQ